MLKMFLHLRTSKMVISNKIPTTEIRVLNALKIQISPHLKIKGVKMHMHLNAEFFKQIISGLTEKQ